MRLKHSAVLVLALCLMGVLSAGEKTQTVKIADKSFKFDGKLLEDCWKSQTPEKDFSSDTGAKLPLETEVMVARDDSAIYFAAKCATSFLLEQPKEPAHNVIPLCLSSTNLRNLSKFSSHVIIRGKPKIDQHGSSSWIAM